MSFVPADEIARQRARTDHATSMVIEAGAGTGKTTLLIERLVSLVTTGAARLDQVACVTFTENAATTMKLRVREALERVRSSPERDDAEVERAEAALAMIERAQISTIHALAAAILGERPLECKVTPGFRVADEAETDLLFAEAWETWLAERMITGDDLLLDAFDSGIPLEGIPGLSDRSTLRGLARTMLDQRDLEPLLATAGTVDPKAWRAELLEQAERARQLIAGVQPGDQLGMRLELLVEFAEQSRSLEGRGLVEHLRGIEKIRKNAGFKPRWPSPEKLEEGRAIAAWTAEIQASWNDDFGAALHGRLVRALLVVVREYETLKRRRGALDYLDLLLLARDALRDNESVRRYFRRRFRFVLIDEFQDTDPLQVEIASLLAGESAGGLVVVGDAKQSIYRFRRADVRLFKRYASDAARREDQAVLQLTQSFRSRPAILRFVNRVFSDLIQESDDAEQVAYEPIEPPPGLPEEPSVIALRFQAPYASGSELLEAEADALVTYLARVARGRVTVRDPDTGERRPSRAGDIMVLVRRLTQLRFLEEALESAELRFAVEGGKSFFDRQEVHETLAAVRAIDDPTDRVSLVAALRSSFFGCSDRDIASYSLAGGRLELGQLDTELPGGDTLGPAFELLERLHAQRTHLSLPALLERLYDETRIFAALVGTRRGAAQVGNLEKVGALARQASELGVLTLRGFARLLAERVENAREEPDLPITRPGDPDTIRIFSIHKAKGLEAPVVALHDSADDFFNRPNVIPLWEEGRIAIGFRKGCQPPGWADLTKLEQARGWAEARRLLYVACTRARDLLVIPEPPINAKSGSFWADLHRKLPRESDTDVSVVDVDTLPVPESRYVRPDLRSLATATGGDPVAEDWEHERSVLVARAAARPLKPMSVTRHAERTSETPPVATGGTGGRAFGLLVHRILEWIPLDDADAAEAMAASLAPQFGLSPKRAGHAAEHVRRVIELPVIGRARTAERLWRELSLWFPEADQLLEGKIDLVFEEDGQLVVLDYKTDAITEDQLLQQAGHHARQLQLYGRGLTQATGLKIRERLVVFTELGKAVPV